MDVEPGAAPPLWTADLPGIGGRIKVLPEDFQVEEVPAYEPGGSGDFLYLWVEKRDLGADYFIRQVARRLGLAPGEIGVAGLKDRRAVTRQQISVPISAEPRLPALDGDGIRVLKVGRHGNKLRPGHLHGNRFHIRIRQPHPDAAARLGPIVARIAQQGLPNYYGPQRFGRGGETVKVGLGALHGSHHLPGNPFLRKLALSAAQSALFNQYLAGRVADGLLRKVLPGDVMAKWPFGGLFHAEDIAREQARFDAREIVSTGPIFGRKTFPALLEAGAREDKVLAEAGLTRDSFNAFGKLLLGTRRHNLIYLDDLQFGSEEDAVWLSFTLPAGSYATVLLRELMKTDDLESSDEPDTQE